MERDLFKGMTPVLLASFIAMAAAAFFPARPWQGHLELIWKLETDDGVNCSALRSAQIRLRRTSATAKPDGKPDDGK